MDPVDCWNSTINLNFSNECLSLLISKTSALLVFFLACISKLPQIISIYLAKSNKGLSYLSIYSEIYLFFFNCVYSRYKNAYFSTICENIIIFLQSVIILMLAWKYSKNKISYFEKLIFSLSLNAIIYMCSNDKVNERMWEFIGKSYLILLTFSRISQIYFIYSNKSTGSLSLLAVWLTLLWSLAKILSSMTEAQDFINILSYVYSAALNFILILVFYRYRYTDASNKQKIKSQ